MKKEKGFQAEQFDKEEHNRGISTGRRGRGMKRVLEKGQGVSGGATNENRLGRERNTYSSVEDIKLQLPFGKKCVT
jgi:hypothetical protein